MLCAGLKILAGPVKHACPSYFLKARASLHFLCNLVNCMQFKEDVDP